MMDAKLSEELQKLRIPRDERSTARKTAFTHNSLATVLLAFFLGIGSSAVYYRFGATARERPVDARAGVEAAASAADVKAAPAEAGLPILTAAGYVIPSLQVEVGSKIIGRIEYIGVERGDFVKRGQIIARLENEDLKAQLRQAEADLAVAQRRYEDLIAGSRQQEINQAKARLDEADANLKTAKLNLDRYRQLYLGGVVPAQQMDAAQNDYDTRMAEYRAVKESFDLVKQGPRPESIAVASAEVERAEAQALYYRTQLKNTLVESPITGVVVDKMAELGEVVAPGIGGGPGLRTAIVRIASLSDMRVEIDVNESDVGKLRVSQPADVTLDSVPARVYQGRLVKIYPEANRQKGTVKAEVAVLDADSAFKPELSAKVVIKQAPNEASSFK